MKDFRGQMVSNNTWSELTSRLNKRNFTKPQNYQIQFFLHRILVQGQIEGTVHFSILAINIQYNARYPFFGNANCRLPEIIYYKAILLCLDLMMY